MRNAIAMNDTRRQSGLSLIEVVVALALLAVVLLGISTLFVKGGRSVKSGKELTEATSVGTDIMEEIDKLSYKQVYEVFGGTGSQTGLTVDTITNSYAQRWQPQIDQRLTAPAYRARATIVLTPLGGTTTPPTFSSGQAIRVDVTVEWQEAVRRRTARFQTTRM